MSESSNVVEDQPLEQSDKDKLLFVRDALQDTSFPSGNVENNPAVDHLIRWGATLSLDEKRAYREQRTAAVEEVCAKLSESGAVDAWFSEADAITKRVASEVNGPGFEHFAHRLHYRDKESVDLFRHGGPLLGKFVFAGNGTRAVFKEAISVEEVKRDMVDRNIELINTLKVNDHSEILMDLTLKDAELGRMSMPVPCTSEHIQSVNISRRFGVQQGSKVRACDDETASKVNAGCEPSERLRVDGLDALLAAIILFFKCVGCLPSLLKADIDSAYRRVSIKPSCFCCICS